LILASRSPRRQELLRRQGLDFRSQPADIVETVLDRETPEAHVCRLATEKARAVAALESDAVVLGSDTVVVIDDEILGKPVDVEDAEAMLARLSGRVHEVHSGVALVQGEIVVDDRDLTRVRFRELDSGEIRAYVASGEPMDKAGAYGIQDLGALLVAGIEGCYFNVMGLPLQALRRAWTGLVEALGDAANRREA
jgi:septum formation protein